MKKKIRIWFVNWGGITPGHFLLVILSLGFVIRLLASYGSVGFLHGDAHFQYLEPAFYHVYGYGILPWEFLPGETVRSWFMPGVFYCILSFFHWMGLEDSLIQLFMIRIGLSLFSILGIYFIYITTKELADEEAAKIAATLAAAWAFFVYFNIQTHGEMMAFPWIVLAHYGCIKSARDHKKSLALFSGMAFCLAFICKFQAAPMAFSLLGYFVFKKEWKGSFFWILGAVLLLIGHGFIDLATHGKFLASVLRYGHLMLFTGHASSGGWGAQHSLSYFAFLAKIFALLFPFVLVFFLYGLKRLDVVSISIILYFVVHSIIPHKEIRYAAPMVPLLMIAAAKGLSLWRLDERFSQALRFSTVKVVIILFLVNNVVQYAAPFVPSLFKPTRPPWLKRRDISLATHYVGKQENSRGVVFIHEDPPGLFYLHKNIPYAIVGDDKSMLKSAFEQIKFNYIVFNTKGSSLSEIDIQSILQGRKIILKKKFNAVRVLEVS